MLASASFWSVFGLPFATSNKSNPGVLSDTVYNIHDSTILIALTALGGIVTLAAIFVFKNRGLQTRLSYLGIVLAILLGLVACLLIYNERTLEVEGLQIEDGIGIWPPIAAIVFCILAGRFIKKDDQLVKSMDRLR